MNKFTLKLLTIFSIFFTSYTFSPDTNDLNNDITLDYEKVGVLHNECLDYILEEIKSQPTTKNGARKISRQLITNSIEEFMKVKNIGSDYQSIITRSASTFDYSSSELSNGISKEYYVELEKVFTSNEFLNPNEAIKHIEMIENKIKLNCTGNDLIALMCGVSVAKQTIVYWEANYGKWAQAIAGPNTKVMTRAGWSWNEFGKNDFAGGVGGAIGGAMFGGPKGALIGGLGGAAGGSATYAAEQLWDWMWS